MKYMNLCNGLVLFLSITAAVYAEKKSEPFRPAPIETYATKQTNQGLTIAAVPFEDEEEAKPAFGKLNPYKHGVLPVLLILKNEGTKTLNLEGARIQYQATANRKVDETPAEDIARIKGPSRPRLNPTPIPSGVPGLRKNKNPLNNAVIVERALAARMLPPGESAHGFAYFQTGHTRGSKLYITGITEADSGKELFYFEVPLEMN